jgi:hypothetical protein
MLDEWLAQYVDRISEDVRPRFTAVVESELDALHEGNFARYRVTPAAFTRWQTRFPARHRPS